MKIIKVFLPLKEVVRRKGDSIYDLLAKVSLVIFAVILLTRSFLAPMMRGEIENNEYPIIAMQYRGSLLLEESDLIHVRQDFPNIGLNVNTSTDDSLRRLYKISEDKWYYYYFPIYPFLCLPLKIFFQLLQVDQERCFSVTNALLVLFSLWFVYQKLRVTPKQKLVAISLLMASPVIYNVNYLYYMTFMSAFVTMSLVQYYNQHYKSSALLLSIAGMANCTIMFVGIVMIIEYLIHIVIALSKQKIEWKVCKRYLVKTACYGACYLPCLSQFIICFIFKVPTFAVNGIDGYFFARFIMYLFDPTLGFSTFAPLTIIVFFITALIGSFKKIPQSLLWGAMAIGTIASFSLMYHINCDMLYCARYIIFCYPIIPMFLATEGYEIIKSKVLKRVLFPMIFAISVFLMCFNSTQPYTSFNLVTQWILNYAPQIYNPYSATFYSRTLHIDSAYDITAPAYYHDPATGEVRKLIFKADAGQAEKVLSDLAGDESSIEYLQEQLYRIGIDGNFHYINFPAGKKYHLREMTIEEKGEILEGIKLFEEDNFDLSIEGEYQIAQFPITIKKNTIYKIELVLADDVNFTTAKELVVDFCAGKEYDRPEQEANMFIKDNQNKYTFYFNSGEFEGDILDCQARVFVWNLDTIIQIKSFSVTEMEGLLMKD